MLLRDQIRTRWNREGLKPGKAGWVASDRENRLGVRTYKNNDTGDIIAIQPIEKLAKEICEDYLNGDVVAELFVTGKVLNQEGVVERALRRLRPAPLRGPSRGKHAPISRGQIVESVERHIPLTVNLEAAMNAAADELGKTGSREYKNLHSWYMAAKKSV